LANSPMGYKLEGLCSRLKWRKTRKASND
jgi:hypothetical protein